MEDQLGSGITQGTFTKLDAFDRSKLETRVRELEAACVAKDKALKAIEWNQKMPGYSCCPRCSTRYEGDGSVHKNSCLIAKALAIDTGK